MSAQLNESPYKVLGVDRNATETEIKQAYFSLVRQHPPERDPEGFKRIRAAYEKLKAGGERAETDLFLIEDQGVTLDEYSIQRFEGEMPEITIDTMKTDLLALEASLLLEELGRA